MKPLRKIRYIEITSEILQQEGIESVTIRKVAERAGCTSAVLYKHFENKEHLLSWGITDSTYQYFKVSVFEKTLPTITLFISQKEEFLIRYGYLFLFKFLKDTLIVIPEKNISGNFAEITKPIYEKQAKLVFENIELSKLRDWLLSMLMNGQARVE